MNGLNVHQKINYRTYHCKYVEDFNKMRSEVTRNFPLDSKFYMNRANSPYFCDTMHRMNRKKKTSKEIFYSKF